MISVKLILVGVYTPNILRTSLRTALHSGFSRRRNDCDGSRFLTSSEVVYFTQLLDFLGLPQSHVPMHTDSSAGLAIFSNDMVHTRLKHISIKLFFVRELVQAGHIDLKHAPGVTMVADLLTKQLSSTQLRSLIDLVNRMNTPTRTDKWLSQYMSTSFDN